MAIDLSKVEFVSTVNYLKRGTGAAAPGSAALTLGGSGATTTKTITHNLGYIPMFAVSSELTSGVIWSNDYVHTLTKSSAAGDTIVTVNYWCDDTDLVIKLVNGTGANVASGDRTVYYVIYIDYDDV